MKKTCTSQNWSVSFSRIGECWRKQISAPSLSVRHHSLSNKVFKLLNAGHDVKSFLKINCTEHKGVRITRDLNLLQYLHDESIDTEVNWVCIDLHGKTTSECALMSSKHGCKHTKRGSGWRIMIRTKRQVQTYRFCCSCHLQIHCIWQTFKKNAVVALTIAMRTSLTWIITTISGLVPIATPITAQLADSDKCGHQQRHALNQRSPAQTVS